MRGHVIVLAYFVELVFMGDAPIHPHTHHLSKCLWMGMAWGLEAVVSRDALQYRLESCTCPVELGGKM